MKDLQEFSLFVDRYCRFGGEENEKLPDVLVFFEEKANRQVKAIEALCNLNVDVFKQMLLSKRINTSNSGVFEFDKNMLLFSRGTILLLLDSVRNSTDDDIRLAALKGLFLFLPQQTRMTPDPKFPFDYFTEILISIVGSESSSQGLEEVLSENLNHQDTGGRMWPALEATLVKFPHPLSPHIVANTTSVINTFSSLKISDKPLSGLKVSTVKNLGSVVQSVWEKLSDTEFSSLPSSTYQALLLTLIQYIMPLIDCPLLLTDRLVSALDRGGHVGLIALQGIFTLIQKHNIDYPNIYTKLYNMFQPEIFSTSYKSRFYYLADIFLTSTHLSSTLVAAFVKRFMRLSLAAPPEDAVILLAMSVNLLIRHPTISVLFHNPSASNVEGDPYDISVTNPTESKAEKSSVWEALLLIEHPVPSVSAAAAAVLNPPPSVEIPLGTLLNSSSDLLFARECKKKMKEPPLTFERPSLIFSVNKEPPYSFWSLT